MRAATALLIIVLALTFYWADEASPAIGPLGGSGGTPAPIGPGPRRCTSVPGAIIAAGDGAVDAVALTFDDGPSLTQTPPILADLKRLGAHATFFEEGRHVSGREALMREILAAGDELGNHSYHHPRYPGNREVAATDRRIRAATGFEPCLFRPPYGLIDRQVEAAAVRNHLELVLWTLDSQDDRHPGAAAIVANVLAGAAPGAIILLHDGGHHPQTVRAVPRIVHGLRARGFRLDTVTELLGGHTTRGGRVRPRASARDPFSLVGAGGRG